MRTPLTIAVAQPSVSAEAHADAIRRSGARVVVFPELSLTGYRYDADPIPLEDPLWRVIQDACRDVDAVALVGTVVLNRCIGVVRVDADAASVAYIKTFLAPSEQPHFVAGGGPAVTEVDGWRIGLGVCFDTCNAEFWETTSELGVDVIAAGVLDTPDELNTQDMRLDQFRPEEVAVAFASFAGPTGEGYDVTAGRSRIVGRDGALLAQAGPFPGEVVSATLI